jgi:hypothetical protein
VSAANAERSPAVRLRRLPEVGARIPAVVVRVALAVLGVLLCIDRAPGGFWFVVGVLLALAAAVAPRIAPWALILLLAIVQLASGSPTLDPRLLVLLAGLHLLYVLAAYAAVLPVRGWVQLAVFAQPLLRFVVIQVVVQAVAVAALLILTPHGGGSLALPMAGIVGAVALVVVALVLVVPLVRERAR